MSGGAARGSRSRPLEALAGVALLVGAGFLYVWSARLVTQLPVHLRAPGVSQEPFGYVDPARAAMVVLLVSAVVRLILLVAGSARVRSWWRTVEYSQVSGITVVLVAVINGVSEAGVIVALYALGAGAVLVQALMSRERGSRGRRREIFSAAAAIGIVPWGVIGLYQVVRLVLGTPVSDVISVGTLALLAIAVAQWVSHWWSNGRESTVAAGARGERTFVLLILVQAAALTALVVLLG
jgi:hypothetical protein